MELVMTRDMFTGIQELDDQHQSLYGWANAMLREYPVASATTATQATLFLAGYVEYHFAAEELTMDLFRFPHAALHRRHHEVIREEVLRVRTEVMQAGGVTLANRERIHHLMRDWMRIHILMQDRKLAEFMDKNPMPSGEFQLPTPQAIRRAGTPLDEYSLDSVRLVKAPGEVSISEMRARSKYRLRAA